MSSNTFLQRFKGKTQTISKTGVHEVLGGSKGDAVYLNNNGNSTRYKTSNSMNKAKAVQDPYKAKADHLAKQEPKQHTQQPLHKKSNQHEPAEIDNKTHKVENPFLVSNPFYLDEEERVKEEEERLKRDKLEQQELRRQKQAERNCADPKKSTQNSMKSRSVDKRKSDKEWLKLGGLGANIGGQEWMERKKKLQKMQVKSINSEKAKLQRTLPPKEEHKETNPRQKAIQYSKKIPKPTIKVLDKPEEAEKTPEERQLSELEQYELRHEQLKHILKSQL